MIIWPSVKVGGGSFNITINVIIGRSCSYREDAIPVISAVCTNKGSISLDQR